MSSTPDAEARSNFCWDLWSAAGPTLPTQSITSAAPGTEGQALGTAAPSVSQQHRPRAVTCLTHLYLGHPKPKGKLQTTLEVAAK